MSNPNIIEETSVFNTTALFSKDKKSRYLLKLSWDNKKSKLAIIMTLPSTAGVELLDQTTMLVRNGAVKNGFGEVAILNLFPNINSKTPKSDKLNCSTILTECEKADRIIVAYGRSTSYQEEKEKLLEMLKDFEDKLYTIIDSRGLPYSHPLSPAAHNWNIQKLTK
ncbi:MAG: DUF1643 domain-containing protein [Eubacterium sp.]|nr:DUF1643 domain-containing protein [Eubacterium sp.]